MGPALEKCALREHQHRISFASLFDQLAKAISPFAVEKVSERGVRCFSVAQSMPVKRDTVDSCFREAGFTLVVRAAPEPSSPQALIRAQLAYRLRSNRDSSPR